MKETVIKNAVENFLQVSNVNSSTLTEACEKFLHESLQELKKEDPLLYEELSYDYSTRRQTKLLENRLSIEFYDEPQILNRVTNAVIKAFHRAYEINECHGYNYSMAEAETILEDCFAILAEESPKIQTLLESDRYHESDNMITYWIKKIPSLLPILGASFLAFGPISVSLWSVFIVFVAIVVLTGASLTIGEAFGVNMHKEQLGLLKDTADIIYRIAKTVKDSSEGIKHRYNVIYQNEQDCYTRSGLDMKKLGVRFFIALKEDSFFRNFLFNNNPEKLDKLRNCYMEHYLEKISIFFELYFDCLRNTGKWNEIKNMSDDKIVAMFRMKGGLYPMCDEYRDNAVKAIRNFEDLVKFFFSKSPEQKSKWMLMLNRYILDSRISKDEQMQRHRDSYDKSKKNPFTSPKYQRLGQDT